MMHNNFSPTRNNSKIKCTIPNANANVIWRFSETKTECFHLEYNTCLWRT